MASSLSTVGRLLGPKAEWCGLAPKYCLEFSLNLCIK